MKQDAFDIRKFDEYEEDNRCKVKAKEMLFWTREEYQTFKEAMKEKPVSYYAFEIPY